jgi:hypothetical protein
MGKLKNSLIDQENPENRMVITRAPDATGTSLQGHIEATYDELVKVFGQPNIGPNEPGKVTCEWCLWIEGSLVTIYDWKEFDETPMGTYSWHIGGKNKEAPELVYDAFFQSKNI